MRWGAPAPNGSWTRSLPSSPLGCTTANRFSFPGCGCCIAIPLVRNIVCQFVRSATSRDHRPGRAGDPVCPRDIRSCKFFTTTHYAGQAPFGESQPRWPYCGRCPSGTRGSGPDGGCDGQRGNASVLTKGMNPGDRLAGDASAIPHWPPPTDRLFASAAHDQTSTVSSLRLIATNVQSRCSPNQIRCGSPSSTQPARLR